MTVEKKQPQPTDTDFESADGEALNALSFRTRVAVLWVAVAVALSAGMLLYVFVPGAVEEMLAGEIEGETLNDAVGFRLAVFVIIPLAMTAVTLLLRDRVNHYVNLIAALAYGLFGVYAVGGEVLGGHFDAHVLMSAVAIALGLLIAALALVGLRQPTDRRRLRT